MALGPGTDWLFMEPNRSTVRDLRRRNRSALLAKLFFDGPLSRQELSQLTGLSVATVSNVTGELVEERLIVEAGLVDSDGGRPRVLLRVDPRFGNVVGIDVGETGVKVELFDLTMNRKATVEHPLASPRPDPAAVVDLVASGLREVIEQRGVDEASVIGVGIGMPGTVEQSPRVRVHAQVIGWDGVPFEELLRAAGVRLPLYFDNGAKTQGQAELWFGAGRGARHAVIALVGSGVGAAVITHGVTYQGATSSAGEWGHTTIVYDGRPCRCGARGCLEAYVGAESILERYRQARGGKVAPEMDEQSSLDELIASAGRSRTAARVLEETAGYLGAGIANLINLFNPERIVLGGWAGIALGGALLPQIRSTAQEYSLRHPFQQTTIEMCVLGPDAVAFGAATLPVAALLALGSDPREDRRTVRHRASTASELVAEPAAPAVEPARVEA
jgi:predicted NBD/HSP70 family sugar kinase